MEDKEEEEEEEEIKNIDDKNNNEKGEGLKNKKININLEESSEILKTKVNEIKDDLKSLINKTDMNVEYEAIKNSLKEEDDEENKKIKQIQKSKKNEKSDNNNKKENLDIIFIHGLRGSFFSTWRIGENNESNWPSEWLPKSLDNYNLRIISIGYPTHLVTWGTARRDEDVISIANTVKYKLSLCGIGSNPIIFITHSLGGILAKELLCQDEYIYLFLLIFSLSLFFFLFSVFFISSFIYFYFLIEIQ